MATEGEMVKGYINRWKDREEPESNIRDYWFCEFAKDAAYWETRESAESDCSLFNHLGVHIPSSQGGIHVCRNFQVEEVSDTHFVIFCEAPFVIADSKGKGVSS